MEHQWIDEAGRTLDAVDVCLRPDLSSGLTGGPPEDTHGGWERDGKGGWQVKRCASQAPGSVLSPADWAKLFPHGVSLLDVDHSIGHLDDADKAWALLHMIPASEVPGVTEAWKRKLHENEKTAWMTEGRHGSGHAPTWLAWLYAVDMSEASSWRSVVHELRGLI